jgi:LAS superfamily LD-carboxypeptidase LdcB
VTIRGYRGKNINLHRLAAAALQAMINAARADGIMAPLLEAVSGYRSVAKQKRLWEIGLEKHGSVAEARKWIAPPGRSPHHSGRAIDLWLGLGIGKRNAKAMASLPVYKWLQINAELFGFYPYTREPWHWEYNPPPAHLELELVGDLEDNLFTMSEFTDDYDDEFDLFDFEDQDEEVLLSEASSC